MRLVLINIFIIAIFIVGIFFYLLEHSHQLELRQAVAELGDSHVHSIEQELNHSLSATFALASIIRQNGGGIADFTSVASDMINNYHAVSSLQLAPDAIVTQIYPLAGNEAAIGHDLLNDPNRRTETLASIESRQLVLAGPFELVQGGVAIVGRYPIFLPQDESNKEEFWGLTIVLIRLPELLEASDLNHLTTSGYDYQLSRIDPDSGERVIFAQTQGELTDPIIVSVDVPNGNWEFAIAPQNGWYSPIRIAFEILFVVLVSLLVTLLAQRILRRLNRTRQQATDALYESEKQYRSLIENTPFCIHEIDLDGNFISMNEAGLLMIDTKAESDIIGTSYLDTVSKEDRDTVKNLLEQSFKGESSHFEFQAADEKRTRWLSSNFIPLKDEESNVTKIMGITQDITEKRQAEQEIYKLNLQLEKRVIERTSELAVEKKYSGIILQNIGDAVVFTDTDGKILYVNPAWEKLTGYTQADVMGSNPNILQSGKTSEDTYKDMWETILTGESWRGIMANKHKDGTPFEVEMMIVPIEDSKNNILNYVGVQRDVTEARQLVTMKERFISDAAHDLGNPVAILQTSLYLMKRDPTRATQNIAKIESATNRLAALVKDLLIISRLDRNILPTEFLPLELSTLVRQIVDTQQALANQKSQKLSYENGQDLPLIMVDVQQFERVIVNLISNALRYTPKGGEIRVSTNQEPEGVSFTVQDNGIGIAKKHLPHIFDRFYRSDKAKTIADGTGLGLSIVKGIVDLHDGKIEIESDPDKGTLFKVILPIV